MRKQLLTKLQRITRRHQKRDVDDSRAWTSDNQDAWKFIGALRLNYNQEGKEESPVSKLKTCAHFVHCSQSREHCRTHSISSSYRCWKVILLYLIGRWFEPTVLAHFKSAYWLLNKRETYIHIACLLTLYVGLLIVRQLLNWSKDPCSGCVRINRNPLYCLEVIRYAMDEMYSATTAACFRGQMLQLPAYYLHTNTILDTSTYSL